MVEHVFTASTARTSIAGCGPHIHVCKREKILGNNKSYLLYRIRTVSSISLFVKWAGSQC